MQALLSALKDLPRERVIPLPDANPEVALPSEKTASACLQAATQFEQQGDLFKAWAVFDKAITAGITEPTVLRQAVRTGSRVNRHKAVSRYLNLLLEKHKVEAEDLIQTGRVHAVQKQFETAEKWLQQAFDTAGDAAWHVAYGFYHEQRSAFGWAETAYKLALRYAPDCLEAQTGLVSTALELGEIPTAHSRFTALADTLAGTAAEAYLRGRLALVREQDTQAAEALFMRAVEQEPWNLNAWLWLGHLRRQLKHWHPAEYAYRHAWYLAPEMAETCYHLGSTYNALGEDELAYSLLTQAQLKEPKSRVVATALLEACTHTGRDAEAQTLQSRLGLASVTPTSQPQPPITTPVSARPTPLAVSTMPEPTQATPSTASSDSKKLSLNQFQNLAADVSPMSQEELNFHLQLADRLMPGPMYRQYLQTIHQWMRPSNYVEIGVETGATLAFAGSKTRCIGIDPEPRIAFEFTAPTEIFRLPSDDFFAQHNIQELLGGPIEFAFIDGLHVFNQVLRDFMNIERNSTRQTVIVFHDCYPINELTQRAQRDSFFWTGDPWKIVPCLKKWRPDLEVMTIKTQPSGLAMVLGADPNNRVLHDHYAEAETEFSNLPYAAIEADKDAALNAIPNDWAYVRKRILAHRQST